MNENTLIYTRGFLIPVMEWLILLMHYIIICKLCVLLYDLISSLAGQCGGGEGTEAQATGSTDTAHFHVNHLVKSTSCIAIGSRPPQASSRLTLEVN